MVTDFSKDRIMINRAYPFMQNFPFNESFEITLTQPTSSIIMMLDDDFEVPNLNFKQTLNFKYIKDKLITVVSINHDELLWISETGENIQELDTISKKIDAGLETLDLFEKRDCSIEAEDWLTQISDSENSLSRETFNEAIIALVGNRRMQDIVSLINTINKLYTRKGLVKISKNDRDLILTYFHFKLVYAKLLLGIVIASKISI